MGFHQGLVLLGESSRGKEGTVFEDNGWEVITMMDVESMLHVEGVKTWALTQHKKQEVGSGDYPKIVKGGGAKNSP